VCVNDSFPNLGIRHVTKKSVSKILTDRLRETLRADKMMEGQLGRDADRIILTGVYLACSNVPLHRFYQSSSCSVCLFHWLPAVSPCTYTVSLLYPMPECYHIEHCSFVVYVEFLMSLMFVCQLFLLFYNHSGLSGLQRWNSYSIWMFLSSVLIMLLLVAEEEDICRQAEMQLKNMPLSVVRLSFRAYLHDSNGVCMRVLPPVISNPIYDSSMSLTLFFLFCCTFTCEALQSAIRIGIAIPSVHLSVFLSHLDIV